METRARSLLVGAFTLAVIAAGFIFVYWLNTAGGLGERAYYRIGYQNTVSGLLVGSPVLFNGVRVGEVTALDLNPRDPRQITATIGIEPATPVSTDTKVSIEFPGFMGSPAVSLTGGTETARLAPQAGAKGEYPLLVADPDAGQSMTQAARDTLRKLDTLLADNAEPLHNTMANLSKFSDALGRNSDKVDGIVAGIERLTGGGSKSAGTLYDLTAPLKFPPLEKQQTAALSVGEPTVTFALGQDKIFVRDGSGLTPIADARWSDMLANMFQARVIQSFENASFLSEVGKGGDAQGAGFQLAIDVRNFEIAASPQPTAVVEFTAKVSSGEGHVLSSQVFRQSVPVAELTPAAAAGGLDKAFEAAVVDLVVWTSAAIKGAS